MADFTRLDEVFNEFDFTIHRTNSAPVTLSYGEPISGRDAVIDFMPLVERAERLACSYHAVLQILGEASTQLFKIHHREWFLASHTFVTVHICFYL